MLKMITCSAVNLKIKRNYTMSDGCNVTVEISFPTSVATCSGTDSVTELDQGIYMHQLYRKRASITQRSLFAGESLIIPTCLITAEQKETVDHQ